jgi:hypothetical protein
MKGVGRTDKGRGIWGVPWSLRGKLEVRKRGCSRQLFVFVCEVGWAAERACFYKLEIIYVSLFEIRFNA